MVVNSNDETFEVTCPFCGDHRDFNSIDGNDGAGQWLMQHHEFHRYEIHQAGLDAFLNDSFSKEDDR